MRRMIGWIGLLAVVVSLNVAGVYAQGNGRKAGGTRGDARPSDRGSDVDINVEIIFGDDQTRLIRAWFADGHNLEGLPPGLAKRETLPPGLQRQLQRNGTLPPGLAKRVYQFPVALERQLPDLRSGLSRVVIGGSIVLLDGDLILDVTAIF